MWETVKNIALVVGAIFTLTKLWEWITRPRQLLKATCSAYPSFRSIADDETKTKALEEARLSIERAIQHTKLEKHDEDYLKSTLKSDFRSLALDLSEYKPASTVRIDVVNIGNAAVNKVHIQTTSQIAYQVTHKGRETRQGVSSTVIEVEEIRPKEEVNILIWSTRYSEYFRTEDITVTHSAGSAKIVMAQYINDPRILRRLWLCKPLDVPTVVALIGLIVSGSVALTGLHQILRAIWH